MHRDTQEQQSIQDNYEEVHLGIAVVRQPGTTAVCFVTQGIIRKDDKCRVFRNGEVVYEGFIDSAITYKEGESGLVAVPVFLLEVKDQIHCYEERIYV